MPRILFYYTLKEVVYYLRAQGIRVLKETEENDSNGTDAEVELGEGIHIQICNPIISSATITYFVVYKDRGDGTQNVCDVSSLPQVVDLVAPYLK